MFFGLQSVSLTDRQTDRLTHALTHSLINKLNIDLFYCSGVYCAQIYCYCGSDRHQETDQCIWLDVAFPRHRLPHRISNVRYGLGEITATQLHAMFTRCVLRHGVTWVAAADRKAFHAVDFVSWATDLDGIERAIICITFNKSSLLQECHFVSSRLIKICSRGTSFSLKECTSSVWSRGCEKARPITSRL